SASRTSSCPRSSGRSSPSGNRSRFPPLFRSCVCSVIQSSIAHLPAYSHRGFPSRLCGSVAVEHPLELVPRLDTELRERLVKVVLHRLWADKKLATNLLIGAPSRARWATCCS